jgi:hypothetical protein
MCDYFNTSTCSKCGFKAGLDINMKPRKRSRPTA